MRLTGNYYYGARYYDPKLSIFLSVDPLVEKTMTAYAYCNNNPINFVDPTGMEATPPDDYILLRNGHFIRLENNKNFDRVIAGHSSNFIQISKGILNNRVDVKKHYKFFGFKTKRFRIIGSYYKSDKKRDLNRIYNFIKNNSDVEYGLANIKSKSGTVTSILGTSYESHHLKSEAFSSIVSSHLYNNKKSILKRYSHIHPGGTTHPSGTVKNSEGEWVPRVEPDKDIANRKYYETHYRGRIPKFFEIALPNTSNKVYYDSKINKIYNPIKVGSFTK